MWQDEKKGLLAEACKPLILKWAIEDLNLRRPPCEDGYRAASHRPSQKAFLARYGISAIKPAGQVMGCAGVRGGLCVIPLSLNDRFATGGEHDPKQQPIRIARAGS